MSSQTQLRWMIAGQIPTGDGSGAPTISLGRELSAEEFGRLDDAIRLLNDLSSVDAYARAVQLLGTYIQECRELAGRDRPPPAALLDPLARSAQAVVAALALVPQHVRESATRYLHAGDKADQLEANLADLQQRTPWRNVVALEQPLRDPRRLLRFDEGELMLGQQALETLTADAGTETDPAPEAVGALLAGGVHVAQLMVARLLLACQEPISGASLLVRHLAAEVLIGAPAVLGFPEGATPTESMSVTHRELPLGEIVGLQQALLRAVSLEGTAAEGTSGSGSPERHHTQNRNPEIASPDEAPAQTEHPAENLDHTEPPSQVSGTGQLRCPPPPGEPEPLDFGALIDHLSQLPAETERAWSKALSAELLGESDQALKAQWGSLLTTVYREVTAAEQRLRARGIDPVLPAHPEDPAVLSQLFPDGTELEQWRALTVAQMRALIGVAQGIGGLTEPRAPFGLGGPDEITWWEAGGFALIRRRAAQLARVRAQLLEAERTLQSGAASEPVAVPLTGPWRDRLTLAGEAVLRGDPEAAVLHLRLVLRERSAQLAHIDIADLPHELEERLAADPELVDLAIGLQLLGRVGAGLDCARPLSLGFALPVAELMLTPIWRLCTSLSAALARAARGEPPDSSSASTENAIAKDVSDEDRDGG